MNVAVLAGLFAAVALLPLLPGLVEVRRRADAAPLPIEDAAAPDPRAAGRRLREAVAADRALAAFSTSGRADPGIAARPGTAVVEGDARVAARAPVAALVCDGAAILEEGAEVSALLDAERSITAGRDCLLGESAATGGTLELGRGTRFRRLWGFPVVTVGEAPAVPRVAGPERTIEDEVVWARDRLSLPPGARLDRDAVVRGDVRIGEGCRVGGSVKAHGSIEVLAGARIEGSLIAHRDVRLVGEVEILGNVFAERDVELGPGTTIGAQGGYKTAFAGRRMLLSPGVIVFGAVVAIRGGRVR